MEMFNSSKVHQTAFFKVRRALT